jgi:dTDP-4-dehydrorhamnose 3,5-epimerase
MMWIPPGFAHGFLALQEATEIAYKCTAEYNQDSEGGYRWDDPTLAIVWPKLSVALSVSKKDALLPYFSPHPEEA